MPKTKEISQLITMTSSGYNSSYSEKTVNLKEWVTETATSIPSQ